MKHFEKQHFRKIHKNYFKKRFQFLTHWSPARKRVLEIKIKRNSKLSPKLLEILRQIIVRPLKNRTKVYQTCIPTTPIVKKPAEMRMGKGKGKFMGYEAVCQSYTTLFTLNGLKNDDALLKLILKRIYKKLP